MKKIYLKQLLTALLLLCCAVATAHDFEVDGIYYNITDATAKTVAVTYKGNDYYSYSNEYSGTVNIPATVTYNGKTYSVTTIGNCAFYGCSSLASITIPNSVTTIGDNAFWDCSSLESITIPNSVTSIEDYAFYGCKSFKEVHISNISAWCNIEFEDYYSNPLYYAKNLYLNGELVTNLVIPTDITAIKNYAFYNCSSLESITIPNSITSIGSYAFYNCSSLASITIPNSVTSIGSCAFEDCSSLKDVQILDGVTTIGYSAFSGCTAMESLYISNTIENIGEYAFDGCNNLLDIIIGSKKAITASENIFSNDAYINACLFVPEGRKFAYERATPWSNFYIVEMDFTGIDDTCASTGEPVIYDLRGNRIAEITEPGIYIVNGKKVVY